MNIIQVDKEKGIDIFCKFGQFRGVNYCLNFLCQSLEPADFNYVKILMGYTIKSIIECQNTIDLLGKETGQISFSSLFGVYKHLFKISNDIDNFSHGVTLETLNDSDVFEQISNTLDASFEMCEAITKQLEDMLENPPEHKAA